jgi:hypothetical protein
MLASQVPAQLPVVFASSAVSGTYIRTIPTTTADPTAASLTLGFPPETFVAVASGGALPDGRDVNGILNELAAPIQWNQAGMFYQYNPTFSAAIGGYPNGAVLQKSSGVGLWVSTVDNNTSDPDTGGANWISFILSTAYEYPIPLALRYGTNATFTSVGDTPVIQFSKTFNQQILFTVPITNSVNLGNPIKLKVTFTSDSPNNQFDVQLQYENLASANIITPSYTAVTDTLTAPTMAGNVVIYTSTALAIPGSALSYGAQINCVLTRLANNSADTNSGNLQIIEIRMVQ